MSLQKSSARPAKRSWRSSPKWVSSSSPRPRPSRPPSSASCGTPSRPPSRRRRRICRPTVGSPAQTPQRRSRLARVHPRPGRTAAGPRHRHAVARAGRLPQLRRRTARRAGCRRRPPARAGRPGSPLLRGPAAAAASGPPAARLRRSTAAGRTRSRRAGHRLRRPRLPGTGQCRPRRPPPGADRRSPGCRSGRRLGTAARGHAPAPRPARPAGGVPGAPASAADG